LLDEPNSSGKVEELKRREENSSKYGPNRESIHESSIKGFNTRSEKCFIV
jgi:hypothetical protein